ncbi:hypothetical protein Acr_11g0004850 [Actinidia rufa]|uniref:Uncharacterized protein n=1 Tax=Actinidia rufa TaxID=165716 RepID=A0A7J0FD53_9ERIC|nr:hypothetical protein Acr_11g0004850 [Actinidia rufa]
MKSWRRNKSDNYNQEGSWQPTVPAWEKKFCAVVGAFPWGKLVDTKKFIHLYENILKWNDSAGEEAFLNAKNRFWAEINGLPCDIASPDPDIYIDKIDWDSEVDPELFLDLEREHTVPSDREKREPVVIFTQPIGSNYLFSSSGWGDLEDDLKKTGPSPENKEESGWEKEGENIRQNGWENVCNDSWNESGWEGGCNNSSGWNQWENNNNEHDIWEGGRAGGGWDSWDTNNRNQENNGRYMSRYKTSRFHGDDNLRSDQWRSRKGRKRVNFIRPSTMDKRSAPRPWHLGNSCAPIGHHGSAKPGHQWGKPVS